MKHITLFVLAALWIVPGYAYPTLTVYQRCGQKPLAFFYKDGPGEEGKKINDSCTAFEVPVTEPAFVSVMIGDDNWHLKHIWINAHNRSVTIDNCTGQFIKHDTISLDIDDAPAMQNEAEYMNKKITQDSFSRAFVSLNLHYIALHPDSFLAVYYLKQIKESINIDEVRSYRSKIKVNNARYAELADIDAYLQNYKFKSIPNIGDNFFEFKAKRADGKTFDSKEINDKVIVMYFCYSGCGPCGRAAVPLNKVYEKYKLSGLEIISFSLDKTDDDWQKSIASHKYPGINVSDLVGFNSPLFLHYNVSAFPFFIVFNKEKKIAMITFGEDEVALVENKVQELLAGK
jgi:cytochrome oxidase Cu insertion factor (SCO1/SenC/PrrC family)